MACRIGKFGNPLEGRDRNSSSCRILKMGECRSLMQGQSLYTIQLQFYLVRAVRLEGQDKQDKRAYLVLSQNNQQNIRKTSSILSGVQRAPQDQ